MASTPRHYIQILDLITARKEPSVKEVGALYAYQFRLLRRIFADKNMAGIGVSEKVIGKRNTGRLTITFYVEKKIPISKLSARKLIPPVIAAPGGQAVFTDVKVMGKLLPQVNKKLTPIESGFSVSHKNSESGTLGAIVLKGRDLHILSNSHVLAKSGTATLGDVILYPGKSDGGMSGTHDVAKLTDFKKFTPGPDYVNLFDAALAKILPGKLAAVTAAIPGVPPGSGTMLPAVGMKVMLKGRTSDVTQGVIEDVNYRCRVKFKEFPSKIAFAEQVVCKRYTQDGDSGAIVVAKDFGKIVGLHFAGSAVRSVFSPIQVVMAKLGFEFV